MHLRMFMIKECRKELIKSWAGAIILVAGVVIVKYGKDYYLILSSILGLIFLFLGAILFSSYLSCLDKLNKKNNPDKW